MTERRTSTDSDIGRVVGRIWSAERAGRPGPDTADPVIVERVRAVLAMVAPR